MNAVIYFSFSKNLNSKRIASSYEGDIFELVNKEKKYKTAFMNMFIYGYKTVFNKDVRFDLPDVNFESYDTIVLVSPVWAGKVNIFMRKYLEKVSFKNKKVILVGSSDGGFKNYFKSYDGLVDESNEIVEKVMYVKGVKQ